jgi:UDP-glucose 4-epimerase
MRILVTGGAGFIGSHLVDKLVEDHQVFVIDNLSTGSVENINPNVVNFFEGDIQNIGIYPKNIDVVYHLAANASVASSMKDPKFDADTNIMGLLSVIEFCKVYNSKLVFTSTGSIYNSGLSNPSYERDKPYLKSYYSANKFIGETYIRLSRLDYSIARLGNVYGTRQVGSKESGVIAKFIDDINNGLPLTINAMKNIGDSGCYRDYIFVKDVVDALVSMPTGTYNVSAERALSTQELALALYEVLDKEPNIEHNHPREGDSPIHWLSTNKLRTRISWQPKYSLEDGLKELIL